MAHIADKKDRTMELYEDIGASMTLLKRVMVDAFCKVSKVLYANDANKTWNAEKIIYNLCSKAEDQMFIDFPNLEHKYVGVFYGGINQKPISDVEERMHEKIRKLAEELVKEDG